MSVKEMVTPEINIRVFAFNLCTTVAVLLLTLGCTSPKPLYDRTFEPQVNPVHGRVIRVNMEDRYVVLECTVLPIEGEQITLYRNEQAVARVRTTRKREGQFMVAILVEGVPLSGDWFRGSTKGHVPQQRQ